MKKIAYGFSLIELLVVIGILTILATLALPSFQSTIERYRVHAAAEELNAAIRLARSEAITRAADITFANAGASTGCSGIAGRWECGWHVFVDANGNGMPDPGEALIQSREEVALFIAATRNGVAQNTVVFDRWGVAAGNHAFEVKPLTAEAADHARTLMLCMAGGVVTFKRSTGEC